LCEPAKRGFHLFDRGAPLHAENVIRILHIA
jgi:hypothetical protein